MENQLLAFEIDLLADGRVCSALSLDDELCAYLASFVDSYVWDLPIWICTEQARADLRDAFQGDVGFDGVPILLQCQLEKRALTEVTLRRYRKIGRDKFLAGYLCKVEQTDSVSLMQDIRFASALSQALLNGIPDCIKVLDSDARLLAMSEHGTCLMEIDDFQQVRHRQWHTMWPDESQLLVRESFGKALLGESTRFRGFCPTAKGTPKWWDVTVSPIFDEAGRPDRIVAMSRDITEFRRHELEAFENESRFQMLADNMAQLAWMAEPDGAIFWYNKRWYEFTGTTLEEMRGWGWQKVHHPDYLDNVLTRFKASVEKGEPWEDTFPLRGIDGEYRWFLTRMMPIRDQSGTVVRLLGTNTDITDKLRVAEELRRSEQKLQIGTAVGGLGLGEVDYHTNTITMTSVMAEIYGLPVEKKIVSRDTIHNLFHPDDRISLLEQISTAAASPDQRFECEHRIIRPDGKTRWLSICKNWVHQDQADGTSRAVYSLLAVRDITAQKETEFELRASRRLADAANQAKSDFLANMSHEIRSPMTAILGYADLLVAKNDAEKEYIETIRRNGQFLLSLLNDILDLSKIEAGKMEIDRVKFCPRKLVEDVCSLMNIRAVERGLHLSVEFTAPLPSEIESDPVRLRQILINLVGNAIKFTEKGSVQVRSSYRLETDQLVVEIVDSGVGISHEYLEKLFQVFEQGDTSIGRRFGGSGLGLAISQRLALMLNGSIQVQSRIGYGSVFALTLDRVNGKAPTLSTYTTPESLSIADIAPATGQVSAMRLAQPRRILVVDDRRDIRVLTAAFVKKIGGLPFQAEDGLEAIAMLQSRNGTSDQFDMVLMDVQMPKMDGIMAVREIRNLGFSLPIIALTANAMDSDREVCLQSGYSDFLSKPIQFERFATIVKHYLSDDLSNLVRPNELTS